MAKRSFPLLQPSSRKYKAPKLPETVFTGQNGATTFVQFGGTFVNAELQLEFKNIPDSDAAQILGHYASVVGDDYVYLDGARGLGGMELALQNQIPNGLGTLRWRYKGSPEVTSIYPGVSTVSCDFVGYFYGA